MENVVSGELHQNIADAWKALIRLACLLKHGYRVEVSFLENCRLNKNSNIVLRTKIFLELFRLNAFILAFYQKLSCIFLEN